MAVEQDTLVFDIETSNFFTDPGVGWNNFEALNISVVGIYSYLRNRYVCFEADTEQEELIEWFSGAAKLVGFSSNRYDIPTLNIYFRRLQASNDALDLWKKERVDLLEEIELATGRRISLSKLAEANLGVSKDRHGSEAITLFKEGRMEELKEYCIKDVRLTRELYDMFLGSRQFLIPNRDTGLLDTVSFAQNHAAQTALF